MRRILFAALLALVVVPNAAVAKAPAEEPRRILVVVDGIAALRNFPVIIAERLGYLNNDEFSVTLMDIRPDVSIDKMVANGQVDAAIAYYHHTIASRAAGMPLTSIAALGVTPGAKIMVANRVSHKYRSPADLKGARIVAGGPYSAKSTVANQLLMTGGHSPDDYVRIRIENAPETIEMLRDGRADIVVARTPDGDAYEAAGVAKLFADLTNTTGTRQVFGNLFPTNAIYMRSDRLDRDPAVAQHLANAFVRTLQYIRTHSPEELAQLIPKEISGDDHNAYVKAIFECKAMYDTDGLMPVGGAEQEYRTLVASFPDYGAVKLESTFTNRFVDKALEK